MEKFLYKRPDKNPKINVWLGYGAIENFAMASLGYLSIFKMLDCDREIFTERIYQDTKTTLINPKDIDCLGFSVSFELDILTIIKMLQKYNFPLFSRKRGDLDPVIFAGGPVMMSNPIPYEEFFDFISIGEKACLKGAFEILKNKRNLSRSEILKQLSKIEGIYVPSIHDIQNQKIKIVRDDIKKEPVFTPILSSNSFFQDTFVLEIERGCPKRCKFCLASYLNQPVRFVDFDKIIEAIDFGLKYTNKIALLGAYVAGHPRFCDIISYIADICDKTPVELSISSLRADLADDNLIKTLVKCSQKTATIALEAGSQRLRDYINKDLTEQQILKTLDCAQKNGLKGMKIYTIIGLPTEGQEDIEAIIELAKKIKKQIKQNKTPFEVTFSSSTFIPKAQTPFERVERFDKKTLQNRIKYLKKELHKLGVNFRSTSIDWDIIQSILSRYDKPLGEFLVEVVEKGANLGAFKQCWREKHKKEQLPIDFDKCSILPFDNFKAESLNWDFIDTSVQKLNRF